MRWPWDWRCSHRRLSFPIVTRQDAGAPGSEKMPHVTCLDCGREFWYDWSRMRIGKERDGVASGVSRGPGRAG